jgi:hypothetical protein
MPMKVENDANESIEEKRREIYGKEQKWMKNKKENNC